VTRESRPGGPACGSPDGRCLTKFRKKPPKIRKYSLLKGSHLWHPSSMGGSAGIQEETGVFAFLGSLPAFLGGPQRKLRFFQSGILEWS